MAQPQSFVVVHGSDRELREETLVSGWRTEAQFQTVRRIVESLNFDFACCLRFNRPEGAKPYKGPFVYAYYTKDGSLHTDRIGARGNILQSVAVAVKQDSNGRWVADSITN